MKTLEVTVLHARHLPKMDLFGSCDAFVVMKLDDKKFESSVQKASYSPDWNEVFLFDASASNLIFEVFDWNRTAKADKVLFIIFFFA